MLSYSCFLRFRHSFSLRQQAGLIWMVWGYLHFRKTVWIAMIWTNEFMTSQWNDGEDRQGYPQHGSRAPGARVGALPED